MAILPGVRVAAGLVPTDSADTFPTHDEQYGKGGWRSVADAAARDAITPDRRTLGMHVFVRALGATYFLEGGIDNDDWRPVQTFDLGVDLTAAPYFADPTGAVDSSPKLAQALADGHRTIWHFAGRFRYDTKVQLPAGTSLFGAGPHVTEIDCRDDYWVEGLRNTDPSYTLDWSRIQISGFSLDMDKGGILIHGHESRVWNMRFRNGLAGRFCVELHAANECVVRDVSAGYGGGSTAFNLYASGIRYYATDDVAERTVNYGDSLIEECSFKGSVADWQGIVCEHLSTNTSLGVINNVKLLRIQLQAPAPSSHPDAVAAGSVWAYNGSIGLKMYRCARFFVDTVDCEGSFVGFWHGGNMIALQQGASRRNTFIGCQGFNCTYPWIDTTGNDAATSPVSLVPSPFDGSSGQISVIGGQEIGPVQPVGLSNGDPGGTFTGKRATYDWLMPGALWFARPGNGQFKAAIRMTDNEHFYFCNLYQETAGATPFDTMPKYLTPRKALGIDISSSLNIARLFRPQGWAPGKDSRILIGNGPGFTLPDGGGTVSVGPLHSVEVCDPFLLTEWTAALPTAYGGSQPAIMVNAGNRNPVGNFERWQGAGVYSQRRDNGGIAWFPVAPKTGWGRASLGRGAASYSMDREFAGKLVEFVGSSAQTLTVPAGLIRSDEDPAEGNVGSETGITALANRPAMFEGIIACRGLGGLTVLPASGDITFWSHGTASTSPVSSIVLSASAQTLRRFTYVRTGATTASVWWH